MRLWHYKLIPYLPRTQLLAQWRELNSIFKKQDKHILINYIYNYDKLHLFHYTSKVMAEMGARNIKIHNYMNYYEYFKHSVDNYTEYRFTNAYKYNFREHDNEYLTICYYNLKEKYLRGQKDFTQEQWHALDTFYKGEIKNE